MRDISPPTGRRFQPTNAHREPFDAFEASVTNSSHRTCHFPLLAKEIAHGVPSLIDTCRNQDLTAAWISKLPAPQPRISPSFLLFRTHICCFLDRTLFSCFKYDASGLSALNPYSLFIPTSDVPPGANCTNLTSQIPSLRPCTIRRQTLFSDGSTSRVQPCRSSTSPQINSNIHCVSS